jgi:predicted RNA-binding protein
MLTKFVNKESSGLVLVPEEDKRPAFKPDAKKEFEGVTVVGVDLAVPGSDRAVEITYAGDKVIAVRDLLGDEIIDPFAD